MIVQRNQQLGSVAALVAAIAKSVEGITKSVTTAYGMGKEKRIREAGFRTELAKQQSRERLAIIGGGLVLGALILTRSKTS